jgi:hypothetical protein
MYIILHFYITRLVPPEKVLLIPKSVPAKFGAKSMKLLKWPLDSAPFKNMPAHSRLGPI